jgi:hypothetical protein
MENLEILVLIVDVRKKILDNVANINVDLIEHHINKTKQTKERILPAI